MGPAVGVECCVGVEETLWQHSNALESEPRLLRTMRDVETWAVMWMLTWLSTGKGGSGGVMSGARERWYLEGRMSRGSRFFTSWSAPVKGSVLCEQTTTWQTTKLPDIKPHQRPGRLP